MFWILLHLLLVLLSIFSTVTEILVIKFEKFRYANTYFVSCGKKLVLTSFRSLMEKG